MSDLPKIIAHRGASWSRPENTALAFDAALVEGSDGIELDLQLTRDGRIVVFHDKSLSMLGLKHRRIGQYTRAELEQFDVGSWFSPAFDSARILDLETVLRDYGHVTDLYLEIKPVPPRKDTGHALKLAERVTDVVTRCSDLNRVYILSFDDDALRYVHTHAPELRCVRNLETPDDFKAMSDERLADVYGVCVDVRNFKRKHLKRADEAARHTFTYTCDSTKHLRWALDLGVKGVITNAPAVSRRKLATLLAATEAERDEALATD